MAHIVKQMHHKTLEVVMVLTNNPNARGIIIAQRYNIPLVIANPKDFESRESYDKSIVESLQKHHPDLTILAGFMRILTPVFTARIKAINLHPSLLPRHKGLRAIEKSYRDTFDEGGVSVHWVSPELDGGVIVLQKSISKKGLSFVQYEAKIKKIEKEALVEAIQKTLKP